MITAARKPAPEIRLDPSFEKEARPLSGEEWVELERSLLAEGCRNPLVVSEGVLLDGHHRYQHAKNKVRKRDAERSAGKAQDALLERARKCVRSAVEAWPEGVSILPLAQLLRDEAGEARCQAPRAQISKARKQVLTNRRKGAKVK